VSSVNARLQYNAHGCMQLHADIPQFNARYFRQMFKHRSSGALMPLFAKACDPAKEWTESFSAWYHMRKWLKEPTMVLHVGDGAHARTAALFAFHSAHENVSIDPEAKPEVVSTWQNEIKLTVQRLYIDKARIEDVLEKWVHWWQKYAYPTRSGPGTAPKRLRSC
jgi:hypothetical protein